MEIWVLLLMAMYPDGLHTYTQYGQTEQKSCLAHGASWQATVDPKLNPQYVCVKYEQPEPAKAPAPYAAQ